MQKEEEEKGAEKRKDFFTTAPPVPDRPPPHSPDLRLDVVAISTNCNKTRKVRGTSAGRVYSNMEKLKRSSTQTKKIIHKRQKPDQYKT